MAMWTFSSAGGGREVDLKSGADELLSPCCYLQWLFISERKDKQKLFDKLSAIFIYVLSNDKT